MVELGLWQYMESSQEGIQMYKIILNTHQTLNSEPLFLFPSEASSHKLQYLHGRDKMSDQVVNR